MRKCNVAVCGVLACIHNECGRCYNGVIALDRNGECLCFERKNEVKHVESTKKAPSLPKTESVADFDFDDLEV